MYQTISKLIFELLLIHFYIFERFIICVICIVHVSVSLCTCSQRSILKKMSVRKKKSTRHKRGSRGGRAVGGGRRKVMTVGGHFRESLQKLMERILSATPHFVRSVQCENELMNCFVIAYLVKYMKNPYIFYIYMFVFLLLLFIVVLNQILWKFLSSLTMIL